MLFLESDEEFELHIWKSEKSDALEAEQDPSSANVRSTVNENRKQKKKVKEVDIP
jgi:hypothetical protein